MLSHQILFFTALLSAHFTGMDPHDPYAVNSEKVWHWEDPFEPGEKLMVEQWVEEVEQATFRILGEYPFTIHYHIYERPGSREPVPWAHTWRYPEQSVHFYIDASYDYHTFIDDWTAPHEISHLSIPYIGERNSWFAEGYASFMQYQVMKEMGIYSQQEIDLKYKEKIDRIKHNYQTNQDLITVARNLKEGQKHAPMYWGGASYFLALDRRLREHHQTTLPDVVKEYQSCCRLNSRSLKGVLEAWDRIIGQPVATSLLEEFETKPANISIELFRIG